jgi:autotransporter-associated beta strand protein
MLSILAAAASLSITPGHAQVFWSGGTGPFTTGTNWLGGNAPTAVDTAIIDNGGTAQISDGDMISVFQLILDNGGVAMTGGALNLSDQLTAGSLGTGTLNMSGTAGIFNGVGGTFNFGFGAGAIANLSMSDSSQIQWAANFSIGESGTATATLDDDASITVANGEFWVGNGSGAQATLTLNDNAVVSTNFWTVIGRSGGNTGTVNLNGSSKLIKTGGGNLIVGDLNGSSGTLNATDSTEISANGELWVGNGANGNGAMNLSGNAIFSNNNWVAVGRGGGQGTLEISDDASFTKTGGGNFVIAVDGGPSTGTVTVRDNGIFQVQNGNLVVGESLQAGVHVGTLNVSDNASVVVNGEFQVGNGATTTTGTLNITGGSVTANNWLAIGRNHGVGVLNLSGGTLNHAGTGGVDGMGGFTGNNMVTAGIGTDTQSTVNHTGGDFQNTSAVTVVGETGIANWNASGGTASMADVYIGFTAGSNGILTLSNAAAYVAGNVFLSSNGAAGGGTGTLNLNGGTLTAASIQEGAGEAGTVHFNGGEIVAAIVTSDFFAGFENSDFHVDANGLKFNTGGNDVTITQALSGVGGLIKNGAGVLELSGANGFTGTSLVNGGTLRIASGGSLSSSSLSVGAGGTLSLESNLSLSDTMILALITGATVNLDFTSIESIGGLLLNGVGVSPGVYTVDELESLAGGTITFNGLDSTSSLQIGAIPEPGTMALGLFGTVLLVGVGRNLRRKH